jgi:hypothetical protein
MYRGPLAAMGAIALSGASLLAACGSSKPAYCTQVSNLKSSVATLEHVEVSPSNLSAITTDVQKVGTSTNELASAVKTEFTPQIGSLKGAVLALEGTLKQLAGAPTASNLAHAATVIPVQVEAIKHAAQEVQTVTKSKCE